MAPPRRITREAVLAQVAATFAGRATPSMDEIAAVAGVSRTALYSLFRSRAELLAALGTAEPPPVAARILTAAGELIAERGLAAFSLDAVAERAGVSRATVYRLHPGKAALLRDVVRAYLPVDEALAMMESVADRPPAEVMGALGQGLTQAGSVRIGLLRTVMFEMARREDGTEEVLLESLANTQVIARYLEAQMAAGRLRTMDPVLAMQAFMAPIMLHLVSRPVLVDYGLDTTSVEEAVEEFTGAWLRAMAPPRHRRARPGTS